MEKNVQKKEFMDMIDLERGYADIDKIKENYMRAKRNIPKSIKDKELEAFVIKFVYNSQRISGSTLTEKETAYVLRNRHNTK